MPVHLRDDTEYISFVLVREFVYYCRIMITTTELSWSNLNESKKKTDIFEMLKAKREEFSLFCTLLENFNILRDMLLINIGLELANDQLHTLLSKQKGLRIIN